MKKIKFEILQIQYWMIEDSTDFVRIYAIEDEGGPVVIPDILYLVPSESMEIGDTIAYFRVLCEGDKDENGNLLRNFFSNFTVIIS